MTLTVLVTRNHVSEKEETGSQFALDCGRYYRETARVRQTADPTCEMLHNFFKKI